ncbi:hypothetical protein WH52_05725 [Tenacibaculum holothuriorum]|uniref:Lipoprotein n=1 Tax=Tenacibaculum holothuriorum TaxID=1635173 RepID=A0A1Y2PCS3_9FLAO|nr:hypothetical protein [Tenacibaculum holothuriorum]OSY88273.1 hypothetical protein WH52_05725 [Tenacibaculum holothuriorum]
MKKVIYLTLFFLMFISCGNNNQDCKETLTIRQFYFVNGNSYDYDTNIEVPCGTIIENQPVNITPPKLKEFTYEVINFEYTINTVTNISKLEMEVKLNNTSNASVKGFPYFTIKTDNLEFSTDYSNLATNSCQQLEANSSCTFILKIEESLNIGNWSNPKLTNVQYFLTN